MSNIKRLTRVFRSSVTNKSRVSPNVSISKRSLRKEMSEVLVDSGGRSSVHGCSSFASSSVPWPLKLVWLGFVICSWTYFAYQMKISITTYYSYDVVTSSSIAEETPTLFPGNYYRSTLTRFVKH